MIKHQQRIVTILRHYKTILRRCNGIESRLLNPTHYHNEDLHWTIDPMYTIADESNTFTLVVYDGSTEAVHDCI